MCHRGGISKRIPESRRFAQLSQARSFPSSLMIFPNLVTLINRRDERQLSSPAEAHLQQSPLWLSLVKLRDSPTGQDKVLESALIREEEVAQKDA